MRARSAVVRVLRAPLERRTWRETLHLAFGAPVGTAAAIYLLAFGYSILFSATVLGLPLLAAVVRGTRLFGVLDRARLRRLVGAEVPALPSWPRGARGLGGWVWAGLTDRAGWRGLAYLGLAAPAGLIQGYVAVMVWGEALLALTFPLWDRLGSPGGYTGLLARAWQPSTPVTLTIGLVAALAAPWVVRGLTRLDRWRIVRMLDWVRRPAQLATLERQRDQAVGSAAAQLRRIERDLHDGAQARMVALALELGRAREEVQQDADPQKAAQRIAAAHEHAKQALVELRDLARGIYPAVLTDLGLDGAVPVLAAGCPVPVTTEIDLPQRPDPAIEATAYLCVAELLTNVAKHAAATAASVRIRRVADRPGDGRPADRLRIEVRDDGAGGAAVAAGGGLAGLIDRAGSVGGRLEISSPSGGPTIVAVELPCAS